MRDLAIALALGLGLALGSLAACSTTHKPEADPERLVPLMKTMDKNTPAPGGAPVCKPEQMIGGATMTQVTLLKIEREPANPGPEREDWINPAELDSPAARELIDPNVDETTKRQAAYELLSAPFYLVYRIDIVDAPMAIGVKDLKRGTVGSRVMRFDRQGNVECVKVLTFQSSLAKSDWAILKSNLPTIDPKVAEALRDDLRAELLRHVAALGRPD
ncbi:MAG TPA: hypothetical protein VFT22_18860 [Kofleriaceae bacterium]|nr:hypothetical protein [Kofleriaceae bacterium]